MTVTTDQLAGYLAARHQQETSRVMAVWSAMTPRERRLVREVAVMANVRAVRRHGGTEADIAEDATVTVDVIGACLHMEDLYPTMARLEQVAARRRRQEATRHG